MSSTPRFFDQNSKHRYGAIFILPFCSLLIALSLVTGCAGTNKTTQDPKETSRLYTNLGTEALMRGSYSQAVTDLRVAIQNNSENAIAINHLGLAYYAIGQKELGKKEFEKAVKIDPNYSDAYINLAKMAESEGQFDRARTLYAQALSNLEYKMRHRALTNLAQLELSQNNIDRARELLYQSLAANPDYCISYYLLGSIHLREKLPEKAAEAFKNSVAKTCVDNPEGHYLLGVSYLQMKEFDKARKKFVYVLEQYPSSEQAKKAGDQLKLMP